MGNQTKSLNMKEVLSANTKWLETVNLLFNLSNTYLMEDIMRASFQYFIINMYLEGVSSHLVLATGRKVTLHDYSRNESGI